MRGRETISCSPAVSSVVVVVVVVSERMPAEHDGAYSEVCVQAVFVLACSVVAALASLASSCAVWYECHKQDIACVRLKGAGVCAIASNGSHTVATASAAAALAPNRTVRDALLRGVCSPGERMHARAADSSLRCVPYYPFPAALNVEMMQPAAEALHMRACGDWIQSGGVPQTDDLAPSYHSMRAHDEWMRALRSAEADATRSPTMATDEMGKFRATCGHALASGPSAVRDAALAAYAHLAGHIDVAIEQGGPVEAAGVLASYRCDSAVRIGVYLSAHDALELDVYDGWLFGDGVLASALQLLQQPADAQMRAERASAAVNALYTENAAASLSREQLQRLVGAAAEQQPPPGTLSGPYYTRLLGGLVAYHGENDEQARDARSYLKGAAAFCVGMLLDNTLGEARQTLQSEAQQIRASRDDASALGRLRPQAHDVVATPDAVRQASSITLSQLEHAWSAAQASDDDRCLAMMRAFYADDIDEARFRATVDPLLYGRMRDLMPSLRAGMQAALQAQPLAGLLRDPAMAANDVALASVRIAGAPRGTWAGAQRPTPSAGIRSGDGVFVAALRQARATFKDRVVGLVFDEADACAHPPLYESTSLNAMLLPWSRCIVMFLGMAHRPWLDAQYDDASLLSRGMWILAHEMAHLTVRSGYTAGLGAFLQEYQLSTHLEAIADVGAFLGVAETGLVDADSLMLHVCQLWCARVPPGSRIGVNASHPGANARCDKLHATLKPHVGFGI